MPSRSARSSSTSSTRAIPRSRSSSINARKRSRIGVFGQIECEEVAGDILQDQCLQPTEVEQAVLQSLFEGGEERRLRIRTFELEQTAQGADTAPVGALLEGGGITIEQRGLAGQQLLFEHRRAWCPGWNPMMVGQDTATIAHTDESGVNGDLGSAVNDADLSGVLVDSHRLGDQSFRHRIAHGIDADK